MFDIMVISIFMLFRYFGYFDILVISIFRYFGYFEPDRAHTASQGLWGNTGPCLARNHQHIEICMFFGGGNVPKTWIFRYFCDFEPETGRELPHAAREAIHALSGSKSSKYRNIRFWAHFYTPKTEYFDLLVISSRKEREFAWIAAWINSRPVSGSKSPKYRKNGFGHIFTPPNMNISD